MPRHSLLFAVAFPAHVVVSKIVGVAAQPIDADLPARCDGTASGAEGDPAQTFRAPREFGWGAAGAAQGDSVRAIDYFGVCLSRLH